MPVRRILTTTILCLGLLGFGSTLCHGAGTDRDGVALIPGAYWGFQESGYELSLLYFANDFGALSGAGLVYGFSRGSPKVSYVEAEVGASGWGLLGFTVGAGGYRADDENYGVQSTFSVQVLPFYFFVRWRQDGDSVETGLMIKIPLPASRRYQEGDPKGVWHLGFD